ncbi:MAG: tetratricopeptide repeat protein [Myxococcales bacterium]|nr:tetratricopeptide repeat protein [Myxococcales bacterium]
MAAYQKLAARYPNSENRADALYNVAVVLENTQQYEDAARTYRQYASDFSKREDAPEVFFRSALVYEKMKDYPRMVSTLEAFIRNYRRDGDQKERIVLAHRKIGDAKKELGELREADRAYASCLSEFQSSRLSIKSRAGTDAANCSFERAEGLFRQYDSMKIEGRGARQVKALQAKAEAQRAVEKAYKDVFEFKRVETTLAASYRIGHSYERFAESLFTAPIPEEFANDEELAMEYKQQLEERAAVLERKAEAAYRTAYEEAKRTRVSNQWTQRTLEGLNKYAPKDFPIQKQGKPALQTFVISGRGIDDGAAARSQAREEDSKDIPAPAEISSPLRQTPGAAPPGGGSR